MGTLLRHAPVVEDDDLIRMSDGPQAMGDDDYRFACAEVSDRLLDKRLVLGVERGGRLVEEHHGRVFQKGPRNGEALTLPARERGAVLAQHRVEPLGKLLDELQAV